ncbi:MAG: hypothetical protein OXH09_16120 [Gammaproteobacteria bacterium]|nr:hypothetical protein [Gammaproteobacteria bacterium]
MATSPDVVGGIFTETLADLGHVEEWLKGSIWIELRVRAPPFMLRSKVL